MSKTFLILLFCLVPSLVFAKVQKAQPTHDDWFGEDDLLFGAKLGPQLTNYTAIQSGSQPTSVPSTVRFAGGASLEFIYPVPRFEIDLFWNARGGVSSSATYEAVAIPFLMKFPFDLDKNIVFELGGGVEPDYIFAGPVPHSNWIWGILFSGGIVADFKSYIFSFEGRYNLGLQSIASQYNGAVPGDIEFLAGLSFHI